MIMQRDREIVRELARKYMEYATDDRQADMNRRMRDTNDLKLVRPPVILDEIPWYQMNIDNELYTEKEKAGRAILERCKTMVSAESVTIGEYRGFELELAFENHTKTFVLTLKGEISHKVELGTDVFGNIQRIDNALDSIPKRLETVKENLEEAKKQLEVAKVECQKEFPQEAELQAKLERLAIVDALLNMDKREREGADLEGPDDDEQTQRKVVGLER